MDAAMQRNSLLSIWGVHAAARSEPSVGPSRFVRASSRERGRATQMAVRWSSRAWGSAAAAVDLKRSGQKALGDVTQGWLAEGAREAADPKRLTENRERLESHEKADSVPEEI
jgi:hypothetical protein